MGVLPEAHLYTQTLFLLLRPPPLVGSFDGARPDAAIFCTRWGVDVILRFSSNLQRQSLLPRPESCRRARGRVVSVTHTQFGSRLPRGCHHFRSGFTSHPRTGRQRMQVVKVVKPILTLSLTQPCSPRVLAWRLPQGRFLVRTETPCQRLLKGFASSGRPPSYALGSTYVGMQARRTRPWKEPTTQEATPARTHSRHPV